ncbi:hypothetical protein OROGR_000749 [Orobanche gracilis]
MTGGCCIPIHGIGLMNDLRIWKYWSSTQENGFILSMVASLIASEEVNPEGAPEKVDPFSLFIETAGITYCLYRDSQRILGNTFGMCILQDFEALTPNLLARTIETVEVAD